ncbi:MAG: AAA family ATPase, partial [Bacteroidaceae bacterium]|nr:AAA family ATPase [Bacteroidaceae bacterium]
MIQQLAKQKALLLKEYEYEREQFQRQTETMGVQRKVRQGLCWFPLRVGRSYFNSLNQQVIEVERTEGLDVEHQFEPGKPVCFFQEDASQMLHYMKFVAQVNFVEENRMVIAMPTGDAVQQVLHAGRLGVQLYLDEYTYRLMFDALDRVTTAKTGRLAQLRDICHTQMPARKFTFNPVRFPWLNPSQEAAVNEVLWAKDVAVVHGPPGTGKTTTLVEAIYETLRR